MPEQNSRIPDEHCIEITKDAYTQMVSLSAHALPLEACGVLAGTLVSQGPRAPIIRIEKAYAIPNHAAGGRTSFSFAPAEWVRVYYDIQKNRQELVGFFHSHPTTPPIPSQADLAGLQRAAAATYWIISFASGLFTPAVNVYYKAEENWQLSMFTQIRI